MIIPLRSCDHFAPHLGKENFIIRDAERLHYVLQVHRGRKEYSMWATLFGPIVHFQYIMARWYQDAFQITLYEGNRVPQVELRLYVKNTDSNGRIPIALSSCPESQFHTHSTLTLTKSDAMHIIRGFSRIATQTTYPPKLITI